MVYRHSRSRKRKITRRAFRQALKRKLQTKKIIVYRRPLVQPPVTSRRRPQPIRRSVPQFMGRVDTFRKPKQVAQSMGFVLSPPASVIVQVAPSKPTAKHQDVAINKPIYKQRGIDRPKKQNDSIECVHKKLDLFDKYLRYHVGNVVYHMMGGNYNATWKIDTDLPNQLQKHFSIPNDLPSHQTIWKKMVTESIPMVLITDMKLKFDHPKFMDQLHYVLYELDRLKLNYDMACIHYIHLLSPKKKFPGLTISIPQVIHNLRSYILTLNGASILEKHTFQSNKTFETNILQTIGLNVFTIHLFPQQFNHPLP